MASESKLIRNPRVFLVPGANSYVVYHFDTGQLHKLSSSAALILELFGQARTLKEVCDDLEPILGLPSAGAVKAWISKAISQEFLIDCSLVDGPNASISVSLAIKRAQNLRDEGEILAAYTCQLYASMVTPEASEVWMELGELAHILGRREDARWAYEEYLVRCPDDAEILHILGALKDDATPLRAPDQCIRQLYSRFADHYEYNMCNELDYKAHSLLAAAVAEVIIPHDSLEILDLGCGTGLISEQLRPWARNLTGIDLSPEMIEHARRRGFYDLLEVAEITEWVGRDSELAFDLIVACDTFIYFGDLSQVIRPVAARLVPGGILAFTVEKGNHDRAFKLATRADTLTQ